MSYEKSQPQARQDGFFPSSSKQVRKLPKSNHQHFSANTIHEVPSSKNLQEMFWGGVELVPRTRRILHLIQKTKEHYERNEPNNASSHVAKSSNVESRYTLHEFPSSESVSNQKEPEYLSISGGHIQGDGT
ncbi:hypothetical protein J6590_096674 [Homalodisca vitripennis]|nr:hypothetical protein J6590_096674 [Homalodisca vitripennis]